MFLYAHKLLSKYIPFYRSLVELSKKIVVPGLGRVPLYNIFRFLAIQLSNETITVRASSIAFNFFLALIPALIFLFSLVPFVPIDNLDDQVFEMLNDFIPQAAFITIQDTLQDIIINKRSSLLSFGFILTIYFASNGIFSLMEAFNKKDLRGYWQKRAVSLLLFLGFFILTIMGMIVFVAGEVFINFLESQEYFKDKLYYFLLEIFRFIISLSILFFSQSLLFYYGSAPSSRYRFFSPGAFLATLLSITSSYLFAYYVDNFSQYNKFYGSLGALIALMIWLNINSFVLIIGYEFNKSILLAKEELR